MNGISPSQEPKLALGTGSDSLSERNVFVLHAAKKRGAEQAELLEYHTSGDVSGDFSRVVGYGAVAIS